MTTTRARRLRVLATAATVPLLLVSACSGGDDNKPATPEDALTAAKTQLDETSGVKLSLHADDLPKDLDALVDATGIGTHAPAFKGTIAIQANNLSLKVPVTAVQGQVFAKLPSWPDYVEIDAEDYNAPDPAGLMDPTNGLSAWLTAATGVEKGDSSREGTQVLTTYTGTVPGKAVAAAIPSAAPDGKFDATFRLDDDGRLASADVTGPFYGKAEDVQYTITLSDYGTDEDISRP